jgi:hypothetical protein
MSDRRTVPDEATWESAVARRSMFDLENLWRPKWRPRARHQVATFGCDFARHLGPALRGQDLRWLVTEPAPEGLSEDGRRSFGYDCFSCRTGNIPTPSLFLQWVEWALGEKRPPDEHWLVGERVFDPFRPAVESGGFCSVDEMMASRDEAISCFAKTLEAADLIVFTLGRNESWVHAELGYEYPMRPGPVAGELDPTCRSVTLTFSHIHGSLLLAMQKIRSVRRGLRFLLTVSPVPLASTSSGRHVLVASCGSQSILRAVAGQMATHRAFVDYFPAFELMTAPVFRGAYFEADQRRLSRRGVDFLLESFFEAVTGARPRPCHRIDDDDPPGTDALPGAPEP